MWKSHISGKTLKELVSWYGKYVYMCIHMYVHIFAYNFTYPGICFMCVCRIFQGKYWTSWSLGMRNIYTCIYIYLCAQNFSYQEIDRKKPPSPGGFSIYYVPWSRAVCKRFHDEMRRSHLVVKSLTHGSWSGNIVNRKPPRGGGVSFDQNTIYMCRSHISWSTLNELISLYGNIHTYIYIYIHMHTISHTKKFVFQYQKKSFFNAKKFISQHQEIYSVCVRHIFQGKHWTSWSHFKKFMQATKLAILMPSRSKQVFICI